MRRFSVRPALTLRGRTFNPAWHVSETDVLPGQQH
jgi:hypothetical protein